MRKLIKISLIVIGSLLTLLLIGFGILSWYVFTPEKLTPILRKQAANFISCQTDIGSVELTLFSTFPRLGIKVDNVLLINPMEGAPSDTLASMGQLFGFVDVEALWKRDELILSGFTVKDLTLNAYIDAEGNANFDVFNLEAPEDGDAQTDLPLSHIDPGRIVLQNTNLAWVDDNMKLNTSIRGMDAELTAEIDKESISSIIRLDRGNVFFAQNEEVFLPGNDIAINLPLQLGLRDQTVGFSDALASLDGMQFSLSGYMQQDPQSGNFLMDINYETADFLSIEQLMHFVPVSMEKFIAGMDVKGLVRSKGNISGFPEGSFMPVLDIHFEVQEGHFAYEGIPTKARDIAGKFDLYTDLLSDGVSHLTINEANARTSQSTFSTRGRLNDLFGDVHFRLNSHTDMQLKEFAQYIPDTLHVEANGHIRGRIDSEFTLSDLMQFRIDVMQLAGKLDTRGLRVVYDSLWLNTDWAEIEFAMPNPYADFHNASFVFADIYAGHVEAGDALLEKLELHNPHIMLETSDLIAMEGIPEVLTSFRMDHLHVKMDTIMLAIEHPAGSASINPLPGMADHPEIMMAYNSGRLELMAGSDNVILESVHLDAEVINDQSQEDIFLQWLLTGFLDIERGYVQTGLLAHPIEIPAIKMDFDPERLDIMESSLVLDKSDFKLSGQLNNILSYFRGDEILQGEFNFVSNTTDVLQLMMLTSGLGIDEAGDEASNETGDETAEGDTVPAETLSEEDGAPTYAGPYMVPEGIDLLLTTSIKEALLGTDTAKNIRGDVRISDGVLLLDELSFVTSAARMQMTAMYRTPRKNHLFLGLDYHMMDIEIERLLEMIPEIDTIMPMLRSFQGQGAFHMAIESYLDSTYTLKMSTLRGAASITGQNLVLMDGETFSEIAKTLRFTSQAENRVDSLSAEFTVFRREIDVYPFLIVMDRYSAVVGGRHNLDMSFNYHISLVRSPLPVRLGIDVTGNMEDMRFSLARPRYAELYRPVSRGVVESRQLELRAMIREALLQRVIQDD